MLILAASPPAPMTDASAEAVEIRRDDFEEPTDVNYDGWPDDWVRRRGRGFPLYLPIEIVDDTAPPHDQPNRCLRITLDGGAATAYSPAIDVSPRFSYALEGLIRCEQLVHDKAYLSLAFFDANENLLETYYSDRLRNAASWTPLTVGPVTPAHRDIRKAVIGVHLRPGEKEDLVGAALFDDLRLTRLPRMTLRCNNSYHVFASPDSVEVTCEVSGILDGSPTMLFELLDVDGRLLASAERTMAADATGTPQHAVQSSPSVYQGASTWKPPLTDNGFYRVRATLQGQESSLLRRELALAVTPPMKLAECGEFGWSLPRGTDPLPVKPLAELLSQVGVRWVKFPVWFAAGDNVRAEEIAELAERLGTSGIEMVAMLDKPPADTYQRFGSTGRLDVATVFAEPQLWRPVLDPVMSRLSLKVRWWQLGADDDISLAGFPELATRVGEIKEHLERLGQEIHLGIVWNWLYESPPADRPPWAFVSRHVNPPFTPSELGSYLAALRTEMPHAPGTALQAGRPTRPSLEAGHKSLESGLPTRSPSSVLEAGLPTLPPSPPAQNWIVLEPLARDGYPLEVRVRDLVMRMLAAKMNNADGIFIPDPFSPNTGLMRPDGTPGELLLPWRTTSLMVSGSQFIGSVNLPGGSPNYVFGRGDQAVMVVWNDLPTKETIFLGHDVRQVDLWGRETKPAQDQHRQVIEVGTWPTFITGVHEPIARLRIAFAFDQQQLASVYGTPQTLSFHFPNPFPLGVGGKLTLHTPEMWDHPVQFPVKLAVGGAQSESFQVLLQAIASTGPQPVRIDFDITADREYKFSVYRTVQVGKGDVFIELSAQLDKLGNLIVTQNLTNKTEQPVSFDCLLFAPDRPRQRIQILDFPQGRTTHTYVLPEGQDLVGKPLWLRAQEINGRRVLNYHVTAER